jgi:hypothetical protein
MSERCPAVLKLGDDHRDNASAFQCQLTQGHGGRHSEEGTLYGEFPYVLLWDGDMRETCEKCGKRTVWTRICHVCRKEICRECMHGPVRVWADEHCKDCIPLPPPPEKHTLDDIFK